jgi:diguanylate cyclase (GGDEF)-like protein/PAS domain S-box-containing protein
MSIRRMPEEAGAPEPDAALPARFFERVVGALGHAVIASGPDGRVLYWNTAATELYGYQAAHALGRTLVDLIVPAADRARAVERTATLRDGPYAGDWSVQDQSGRIFTVHVTSTVILDDNGQTIGTLGVSYDVSERRRAEHDARRLAAIVEGSADAIIESDPAGLIRSANAAVGSIFGCDPAGLVGRDIAQLVPAEQRERFDAAMALVRAGGAPGVLLLGGSHADGTLIDVALRLSAVRDDAGRIVGVSGITRDVTVETRVHAALASSEPRSRARFDQSQVPQTIQALDGTLTAVNNALCLLLDRDQADLEGLRVQNLRHPSDPGELPDPLTAVLTGAVDADTWERILTHRDGSAVPVVIHAALLREADGTPYAVAMFVQDLTALRRAERALTRRKALFEAMDRQASEWAMVIGRDGFPRYVSSALTRAFGYDPPSIAGRPHWDFVHPDDLAEVRRTIDRVSRSAGACQTALFRAVDTAGRWRWVENVFTNCLGDPDIAGIVCNGRDVTERVDAEHEVRKRALRDDLTGLANRAMLGNRIDQALSRRQRDGDRPVSVIFADLDQFKLVNDSWGHAAGDRLLVAVAGRLAGAVRPGDTVARFGGDEFVIVCEDTDEAAARAVAERLQAALGSPFDIDGRRAYARASLGIAISPPHAIPDLLRFADAAMYAAKAGSPGRVQVFDVALANDAADRLALGNDLREALARDELMLHYQPVVELATGSLVGLEALARWSHPLRGAVSPLQFVSVAETSGIAPAFNRWALQRAARDAGLLRGLMPTVPRIAVNISLRDLMETDLEADVLAAVVDGALSPDGLVLEITESTLMDNPDQTRQLLERLRVRGIETAIDDFGTGYSSLGYLQNLPVTTLKIDRSFIQNITVDPDSLAITASVIALARSMRMATIAEGVETMEQLTLLQSLGCWAAQGYLWSPALPPEALALMLDRLPGRHFDVGLTQATA